jgi:hypothetical protein
MHRRREISSIYAADSIAAWQLVKEVLHNSRKNVAQPQAAESAARCIACTAQE